MPQGLGSGTPLIQHGRHGAADHDGVALVAECGQHFKHGTGETAIAVALDFLGHFGLIEREPPPRAPQQRYELLRTCVVRTPGFRFSRPLVGFETFAEGELIATDGDEEIRAPCAGCTVLMPARRPTVGREGMYLARPMA
jgi:succinylglutamate desuccinylase